MRFVSWLISSDLVTVRVWAKSIVFGATSSDDAGPFWAESS